MLLVGPEIKRKKKTDLLSYEDWCTNRFGRKRVASFEHDTPSKRRKRDVADYRTPRYVEVDLCLTGHCDNVPIRMLRLKPKRQYKKGAVRSLNLGGTVSSPGQKLSNWLKQANEIPLNVKQISTSRDHSPMHKFHDFMMGKNVGSSVSSGVIVKTEYADRTRDVCVIDDSDEENGASAKPIQRPFFSIFRSRLPTTPTFSSQKVKQTESPSDSGWNSPELNDSPAPSCSKPVKWSMPYISEQEKEINRIKIREKLAKYSYTPLRKDHDTDTFIPSGVDGVALKAKSKLTQFACSPKEGEQDTVDTRQVSILGDATHITINAKDYATDLSGKEASPRKYRFQVHRIGMINMHC